MALCAQERNSIEIVGSTRLMRYFTCESCLTLSAELALKCVDNVPDNQ